MNEIGSIERALPAMTSTQAQIYLRHTRPEFYDERNGYRPRRATTRSDGRVYEVHEFANEHSGGTERFFFDVTPHVERVPPKPDLDQLDLPGEVETTLGALLPDVELARMGLGDAAKARAWLSEVRISFRRTPSETLSKHVAAWMQSGDEIRVTPLRDGTLRAAPMLHGFHFYKLFIVHQLMHRDRGFATARTETAYRTGRVTPGVDCMAFTPLAPFDFARDFINYSCWTHAEDAFLDPNEAFALRYSAAYGVRSGLFTCGELRAAILAAHTPPRVESVMLDAVTLG